MRAFDYQEPASVAEACELLAAAGPEGRPLAGGTDLLIQMEMGRARPATVVYLGRVPELQGIDLTDEGDLRVAAGATLREVELHPLVRERHPALHRGAAEVGSVQIRNLATLAGNLCNASPSADTSPALLAYDAVVEIAGRGGHRSVPVDQFWTGPGRTVMEPGELVTAIRLPQPPPGQRSFYRKLAVRKAMDLAMVGVCVTAAGNGSLDQVRIAVGAVAPTCRRAVEAEDLLLSGGSDHLDRALEAVLAACSPISDQRASAGYRLEMVRVLTRRALQETLGSTRH